jgi:hypothetical protein
MRRLHHDKHLTATRPGSHLAQQHALRLAFGDSRHTVRLIYYHDQAALRFGVSSYAQHRPE